MTNIHAAIGSAQLAKVEGWTRQRQHNAARLTELLGDSVVTPVNRDWAKHVFHQYTVRIPGGRGDLPERLAEKGVGTGVHYPIPVHKQPMYVEMGFTDSLPVAEQAAREVISLPVHPTLSDTDIGTVAAALTSSLGARV